MALLQREIRIVMMAKIGSGKSATGNSLLHSPTAFVSEQSAMSITRGCQKVSVDSRNLYEEQIKLAVVDTPGFFDTDMLRTNDIVEQTIASEIFDMTSPGVHAFLIILCINRFTPEEKNTVEFIKTIFGKDAAKYCIVVFTREDQLDEGQTIDDFINSSTELKELVETCGNRKFAINNKLSGKQLEIKTNLLLQMIDQMVQSNNDEHYTNEKYRQIEQKRKKEEEKEQGLISKEMQKKLDADELNRGVFSHLAAAASKTMSTIGSGIATIVENLPASGGYTMQNSSRGTRNVNYDGEAHYMGWIR